MFSSLGFFAYVPILIPGGIGTSSAAAPPGEPPTAPEPITRVAATPAAASFAYLPPSRQR